MKPLYNLPNPQPAHPKTQTIQHIPYLKPSTRRLVQLEARLAQGVRKERRALLVAHQLSSLRGEPGSLLGNRIDLERAF